MALASRGHSVNESGPWIDYTMTTEDPSGNIQHVGDSVPLLSNIEDGATTGANLDRRASSMRNNPRGSGFVASVFLMTNAIMGSGVLGLAYAMRWTGIVEYVILLMIMCAFSANGTFMLLESSRMCHRHTYEQIGRSAFRRKGHLAVSISTVVQNIGSMTSYCVVMSTLLPQVMADFICDTNIPGDCDTLWVNKYLMMMIAAAVFIFPLMMLRDIKALSFTSFISIAIQVSFVSAIIFYFTSPSSFPSASADGEHATLGAFQFIADRVYKLVQEGQVRTGKLYLFRFDFDHIIFALPTMCFSFVCHTALLPVYRELKNRSIQKMQRVAVSAFLVAFTVYFISALFAYMTFRERTLDNLIAPGLYPDTILMKILRLAMCFSFVCSIVLVHYPCRRTVDSILFYKKKWTWLRHIVEADVLLGIVVLLALTVPDIKHVFAVAGATSSISLAYVMPSFFYLKISAVYDAYAKQNQFAYEEESDDEGVEKVDASHPKLKVHAPAFGGPWTYRRMLAVFQMCFGIILGSICVSGIVRSFFHPVS